MNMVQAAEPIKSLDKVNKCPKVPNLMTQKPMEAQGTATQP